MEERLKQRRHLVSKLNIKLGSASLHHQRAVYIPPASWNPPVVRLVKQRIPVKLSKVERSSTEKCLPILSTVVSRRWTKRQPEKYTHMTNARFSGMCKDEKLSGSIMN